ncbi:DUF2243 domain-containing protein [Thermocoleostomius sinensis]|jgi:uncharacterized membrane protein|uniref:DUF2243 domain-containing protein n=1 Tax=Thermocoleostomius sinensis A174 TaxID=2016057 RepID=A0A9E8ZHG8_9CYAN|nr:DUF2243 domain-containing protein [Thermocoleostomius sinensis]WAL61373.1 DUF2243 domain-containing protein [Thermocoleostomius sinensis A174]
MNSPNVASQPNVTLDENHNRTSDRPLIVAGLVLGVGQGGFFDGIIFHQLLQWHHMFSSIKTDMTVAGLELNTIGDGLFHLFDWLMTLLGLFLLWRAGQQSPSWSGRVLLGAMLIGFGVFNFVEGILDHHLLGIHHLKPGPNQLLWDLSFLASGVILVLIGLALVQSNRAAQVGK